MNSYYVVDLSTASATKQQTVRDLLTPGGVRVRPEQLLHWRAAKNEVAWLIQAEVTAAEHSYLTSGARAAYITYLGDYDPVTHHAAQAVYDYLAAHPELWLNLGP